MTDDLEQKARETLYKINQWRDRVIGGYKPTGDSGIDIIAQALREVREADAKLADSLRNENGDYIAAAIRNQGVK